MANRGDKACMACHKCNTILEGTWDNEVVDRDGKILNEGPLILDAHCPVCDEWRCALDPETGRQFMIEQVGGDLLLS
jgi:hypothetical protein